MNGQDWRLRAACLEHPNPDMWFPGAHDDAARDAAKSICAACPVRAQCLADALRGGQRSPVRGIWGGTTQRERAELVKSPGRQLAAHAGSAPT